MASANGTKPKTYYVREDLARVMAMIASRADKRESALVDEAFIHYIESHLSNEEQVVFGYKKEKNGHAGRNGSDTANGVRHASKESRHAKRTVGGPPGRARAAR